MGIDVKKVSHRKNERKNKAIAFRITGRNWWTSAAYNNTLHKETGVKKVKLKMVPFAKKFKKNNNKPDLFSHLVFKNLLFVKNLQSHRVSSLRVPCKLHFCKCSLTDCSSHLIFTHSTLDFRLTHAQLIDWIFLASQFCNFYMIFLKCKSKNKFQITAT